ncbi:MAG: adenylate/guanylate cyclase domain-containing protein [Candidatus Acidiferrales bacterium]
MRFLDRLQLSIQSKLMIMLLLVAVSSIGVISWIAYAGARQALTASAFDELTSVRASKKIQLEAFFRSIRNEVSNLAADPMMVGATRDFSSGFAKFGSVEMQPEWDRKLEQFYRDDFLPKLAGKTLQTPRIQAFLPQTPAARYAQYQYIAKNPYPTAERYKFLDAGDGSDFSKTHALYQPIFTKFMLDLRYDNLILISPAGDVVYTFTKSPLFGTNVANGPYSDTAVGDLFRTIQKASGRHKVQLVDFSHVTSALNKPVALMGAPIFDGPDEIGMVFIQFPIDEINRVMTDNHGWTQDGLGKTGEVYLAGPDRLMRSQSRIFYENPSRFYEALEKADYPPQDIDHLRRAETTILEQSVHSHAVDNALAGKTGTAILPNYMGLSTLSSFAPIDIPGLQWVIVAEMDAREAFAPLTALTHRMMTGSLITLLAVTVVAAFFGRRFVRPIFRLVDGVQHLEQGERDALIEAGSRDEFEDLGAAFNRITTEITAKNDLLEHTTRQRDEFIDHILPVRAAARLKRGQPSGVDAFSDISILCARFITSGSSALSSGVHKSLDLFNDLIIAVGDAAERRGVERVSSDGLTYIACCGLSRERLDHASRIVDFAQDVLRISARLHRDRQVALHVQIGIDSGPAAGGIIGRKRFSYHLSGETLKVAAALAAQPRADSILVSERIHTSTERLYQFGSPVQVAMGKGESFAAWPLKSSASHEVEPRPSVTAKAEPGLEEGDPISSASQGARHD